MKLIKPYFEIYPFDGMELLRNIEKYGRTCYKSESTFTDKTAVDFVKMILQRGHESVIEHEKVTVRIICDRGVSHEIVRHRIASYSQESTRYCNYSKDKFENQLTFIIPCWINEPDIVPGEYPKNWYVKWNIPFSADQTWFCSMMDHETQYLGLIEKGWKPERARSVLPNSLKTEIVITYNLREWMHFFRLRCSSRAHLQMREITIPLLLEFKKRIPIVFDDMNF